MALDVGKLRRQFPSLDLKDGGKPRIYLDNPAGTQAPIPVIERMKACLIEANANLGGGFATSQKAEALVKGARAAMADFLGAQGPQEIIFGANMTTLTFHIARSIGRICQPGDDIILARMCHDANVQPWRMLAEDLRLNVKWLDFNPETYEYDPAALDGLLSARTRLVAIGYASNVLGTINPVKAVCAKARAAGALSYVDAVHYAPHGAIDVAALGCDFLACSVYKFYGPHVGVLYGRAAALQALTPYKVRPAPDAIPECFETGTQNHEGLAGTLGAIDYLESLGKTTLNTRRARLVDAMNQIAAYETGLAWRLIDGLAALPGLDIHGLTQRHQAARRAPTVSFTTRQKSPRELAAALAAENIFAWAGHSYAIEPLRALGLLEGGGVLRLGIAHYNTAEEVDRTISVVASQLR